MKFKELKISILKDFCDNLTDFFDSIGISGYYEILYDSEKKDKSQIIQDNTSLYIYIDETDIQLEVKILIFFFFCFF